jgi:hypothetical protein
MIKLMIFVLFININLSQQARSQSCKLEEFIHTTTKYGSLLNMILQDFKSFRDLNTSFCEPRDFDNIFLICIYPSRKLILNNEFDTEALVHFLSGDHGEPVIIKLNNLLGFDLNYQGMQSSLLDHIEFSNSVFDFFSFFPKFDLINKNFDYLTKKKANLNYQFL